MDPHCLFYHSRFFFRAALIFSGLLFDAVRKKLSSFNFLVENFWFFVKVSLFWPSALALCFCLLVAYKLPSISLIVFLMFFRYSRPHFPLHSIDDHHWLVVQLFRSCHCLCFIFHHVVVFNGRQIQKPLSYYWRSLLVEIKKNVDESCWQIQRRRMHFYMSGLDISALAEAKDIDI